MRSAAEGGPAGIGVELRRRFRADPEHVFRAWTEPAALRRWWCPPGWVAAEIEIDLRIGGRYRIAMTRRGAGETVAVIGEFLEVAVPRRLVYTWRWEGAFPEMSETVVTVELEGTGGETLLTIRHDNFGDLATRHQHRSGWIAACSRLDRLVAPAAAPGKKGGASSLSASD
jgi:uncharacterized protein YndB with AHSA1/START domain